MKMILILLVIPSSLSGLNLDFLRSSGSSLLICSALSKVKKLSLLNLRESYAIGDVVKIRVFSEDRSRDVVFKKLPFESKSQIYHEMYYRVRDFQTDDIIDPDNEYYVKNAGLPIDDISYGKMIIDFNIIFPENLTEKELVLKMVESGVP